ncbi:uncharacterized protein LOC129312807 [Prosopis cineraria]|uniref:uncharacterized protein LOC129312807 n=1 Tax=Prosopis cineraria TaxID=364024 RepID=UPI00240F0109|nr:uncharacterized protein LOC129312807 [Prosopis cineraria]
MKRSIHDFIDVDNPFEHGIYDRDHTNRITLEVVDEVLHHGMISTIVMDFYLRFLYHILIVPCNLTRMFVFICPCDIATFYDIRDSDHEDQAKQLCNSFKARTTKKGGRLFLIPYVQGIMMMLIVKNLGMLTSLKSWKSSANIYFNYGSCKIHAFSECTFSLA